jgi:hypothetical protein
MNAPLDDVITLEQQVTQLLSRLERVLSRPTFSYRLDEIQCLVIQLREVWALYQRRQVLPTLEGTAHDTSLDEV